MVELGDFSRALTERWAGVLFQQGRVTLDTDATAQTLITVDWQDAAASDIIGSGVAAIPADDRDAFLVQTAAIINGAVTLQVQPGRSWVNGRLVRIESDAPVLRTATYLGPPFRDPLDTVDSIRPGVRDAVVLEVWREAVSGFQEPDELIEPALGGPDTSERLRTAFALRLLRLEAGETCESVPDRLIDDVPTRGRLTVELEPQVVIGGDCPVVEGGGYSGFEHSLYRVEIARTKAGAPKFKWSQFNGGLVGRALFDAIALRATITANLAAIASSGLDSFYLEAIRFDEMTGRWEVEYGATVTLGDENQLVLPATSTFGDIPGGTEPVFIRLWNGIERLAAYPSAAGPVPFRDGIQLAFDPPGPTRRYTAGDYWTFPVRAGDIENVGPFPTDAPPEGPVYQRVPIAILNWGNLSLIDQPGAIEDCRRIFNPLTRLDTCCSFRVGDGLTSHGEFESIQEAIDHLPAEGGEICVLPGTYRENVRIVMRRNVTISGCSGRSVVVGQAPQEGEPRPVFHVVNSQGVRISGLAVRAQTEGVGILVEDNVVEILDRGRDVGATGSTTDITLTDLLVSAAARPAIEVHGARNVTIREDVIDMADVRTEWPAIFFQGEDGLIERNVVRVRKRVRLDRLPLGNLGRLFLASPVKTAVMMVKGPEPAEPTPAEPAPAEPTPGVPPSATRLSSAGAGTTVSASFAATAATHILGVAPGTGPAGLAPEPTAPAAMVASPAAFIPPKVGPSIVDTLFAAPGVTARLGLGGIQIGGLSERVRVVENFVQGGAGNGITLGSVRLVTRRGIDLRRRIGWFIDVDDDGGPCLPGHILIPDPPQDSPPETPIPVPAGALREIVIERNQIFDAGLNGIGVVGFFALTDFFGFRRVISVERLRIDSNEIKRCLTRPVAPATDVTIDAQGFGGIALADVDGLAIRQNIIEDNGSDYLDPICGVFVLHGEGVEIADNRIVNNGAPTAAPPANARPGRRGGIHLVLCSAPIGQSVGLLAQILGLGRQDGTAALRVRDNIVSAPLGQALTATANGPVFVHGNTFTSLGIAPRPEPLRRGLFGACVTIFNLGRSAEEHSTPKYFAALAFAKVFPKFELATDVNKVKLDVGLRPAGVEATSIAPGIVQFSDNQCLFMASLLRPPMKLGRFPFDLFTLEGLSAITTVGTAAASGEEAPALAGGAGLAGGLASATHAATAATGAGLSGATVDAGTAAATAAAPAMSSAGAPAAFTAASPGFTAALGDQPVAGAVVDPASPHLAGVIGSKPFGEYSRALPEYLEAEPVPLEIVGELLERPFKPLSPGSPGIVHPEINPGAVVPLNLSLRLTSISISSLDDIGIHDNQCLTTIPEGTLLAQLFAYGDSVRATANRFKEGPSDAIFSAITLGGTNVTAHNEATHCLVVRPIPLTGRTIDGPNIVVVTGAERQYCLRFEAAFGDFGKLGG